MSKLGSLLNVHTYIMLTALAFLFLLFIASKKNQTFRKAFIVVALIYNVVYLGWRCLYTLPLSSGIISITLGVILLLAEFMGFWQTMVFRFLFWRPHKSTPFPENGFDSKPTVDVFIATYNENMKILKKTIIACLNLDYPKDKLTICLCDDGRRPEAKALCEEMGIRYISRTDNKHAKAGNLNNALSVTDGEFVMLLDADMVPKSGFLQKTIDYFADEKVGFIQTPQIFYNPDPFQHNLGYNEDIPNEQDFFMIDIQGQRTNYNAVLHVGTNAVFRRKALDDIGGIPTGTITEDMATGLLIQVNGYNTIFVKEILCTGLSVESFSDLIKQRERWCRGNIQVSKKWNPLTMKGLTFAQRMIYVDGLIYWFFGVQKMIYMLWPILFLITGVAILDVSAYDMMMFWIPSFFASILTFRVLTGKNRSITWSHIYEVAMAPFLALASLVELIFSQPIPFKVTPKGTHSDKSTFSFRTAIPHMVLFALTVIGWALSAPKIMTGSVTAVNSVAINLAWSVYNMYAILMSIFVCIERPRKRTAERVAVDGKTTISLDEGASCRIVDISDTGVKVECDPMDDSGDKDVRVDIESVGELTGTVAWRKHDKDKESFGIAFDEPSTDTQKELQKFISDKNEGYHGNKK